MACRDCSQCTESVVVSLLALPFRVLGLMLTFWNVRLFMRFCPHCRHRMRLHRRLAGGRFAD